MDGKSEKGIDTSLTCIESFHQNFPSKHFKRSAGYKENIKNLAFESRSNISNASFNDDYCDYSLPNIEVLRGDRDNIEKESPLEKEIEEKKLILKQKRQHLAEQLLSYKLMQFSSTPDVSRMYSVPTKQTPPDNEFKVPDPVSKQADSKTSSSTSSSTDASLPNQVAQFFEECGIPYGFEETMLDMAIQASLADVPKTTATTNVSTPSEDGSSPEFSGKAQTESENRCYPAAQQYPDGNIPGSSLNSESVTDLKPLLERNTSQLDTKNQSQQREDGENIVDVKEEDFMETDRYIGDKGKRPLSGKFAYKKRSKPSRTDSDEQSSGSSLPKEESSAE